MLPRMRSHLILSVRVAFILLFGFAVALPVRADVVPPPPDDCPDGTTARTSHYGPYCEPPPPESCPPGHLPLVYMDKAFCEPPPPEVCPPGSFWTSKGPGNLYCHGGRPCGDYPCPDGHTCTESSLCVRQERQFRMMYEVATKVCEADGDCGEGETCVTAKRCDPVEKRQPAEPADPDADPAADPDADPAADPDADPAADPVAEQVASEPLEAPAPAVNDEADTDDVEPKGCSVGTYNAASATLLATLSMFAIVLLSRRR